MKGRKGIAAWRTLGGGAAYALVLLGVANLVFVLGLGGAGTGLGLARTSTYGDLRLPAVAAVDSTRIGNAIAEAGGGPATLSNRAPADLTDGGQAPPVPQAGPRAMPASTISPSTTPTYTAATQVSTLSVASLLAQIPVTVRFPPARNPKGR